MGASAEIKLVVWQTLSLGETRAPYQLPIPAFVLLIVAPIILALIASVRGTNIERLWVWFAILFLLSVIASSAQTFGALHLWAERAVGSRR